jgi:hypothetical protein
VPVGERRRSNFPSRSRSAGYDPASMLPVGTIQRRKVANWTNNGRRQMGSALNASWLTPCLRHSLVLG